MRKPPYGDDWAAVVKYTRKLKLGGRVKIFLYEKSVDGPCVWVVSVATTVAIKLAARNQKPETTGA